MASCPRLRTLVIRGQAVLALDRGMRGWLAALGHDAYRDGAELTAGGGGDFPPASR